MKRWSFYEFFSGGGMARAGLGAEWECTFANDIDPIKCQYYRENWTATHLIEGDVGSLTVDDLPARADLAWASFPCQDLSLAGSMRGMDEGTRSGAFWGFWRLMSGLAAHDRSPSIIALENVLGFLRARGGEDFGNACRLLALEGYQLGAVVVDAAWFIPQSRPRVFVLAVRQDIPIPKSLLLPGPNEGWHHPAILAAWSTLPLEARRSWVWWRVQTPFVPTTTLSEVIEDEPTGVRWNSTATTEHILSLMDAGNAKKVEQAKNSGLRTIGTIYRRVRPDGAGRKSQRAEVRFDGIAGCLRTPSGGSSRQTIIVVEGQSVRTRLISSREAARLMGLPDTYRLPARYNDAYLLVGDGVAVPVVRHLAERIFEPLLAGVQRASDDALTQTEREAAAFILEG